MHTVGCGADGQDEDVDQGDVDRRQTEDDNTDGDEEGIVEDPPAPRKSQRSGITREESEAIKAKLEALAVVSLAELVSLRVASKRLGRLQARVSDMSAQHTHAMQHLKFLTPPLFLPSFPCFRLS